MVLRFSTDLNISKGVSQILTEREIEYLSLISMGLKNHMIAEIMYVSFSTVKKTLEVIFRKLGAKDRTNAVVLSFEHKILDFEVIKRVRTKYINKIKDIEAREQN